MPLRFRAYIVGLIQESSLGWELLGDKQAKTLWKKGCLNEKWLNWLPSHSQVLPLTRPFYLCDDWLQPEKLPLTLRFYFKWKLHLCY